jgi:Cof subfamily protein (haloacid dehalogenase superfamily)
MKKLVVTDLDGTLFNIDQVISTEDINTLKTLGEASIIRVIATGRSIFSAKKALPADLPIDYLIFSSGAGIEEWKTGKLMASYNLTPDEVNRSFQVLANKGLDIFVLDPVPDNHRCKYFKQNKSNPDFERRVEIYKEWAVEITQDSFVPSESCQLIAIDAPENAIRLLHEITNELNDLSVIRSTSPLDHQSVWIEIYSKKVSKAMGLEYLSNLLGISSLNSMAIGNDFNDLDMLRWAGKGFVVANAPEIIKDEFTLVESNSHSGFSKAVNLWLKRE